MIFPALNPAVAHSYSAQVVKFRAPVNLVDTEAAGRSIPDAARLAGMELSEWMALEAGGLLPQTPEQLRAIAGALEVDYDWMASWVVLCWSAWEG